MAAPVLGPGLGYGQGDASGGGAANGGLGAAGEAKDLPAVNPVPVGHPGQAPAGKRGPERGAPETAGSFPSRVALPVVTVPVGERSVGGASVVPGTGPWEEASLQAATSLSVPLALGGVVVVFIVVQWLIDRRDPKFVEAPARKDDDSVGFD